jgi:hypothetical protein
MWPEHVGAQKLSFVHQMEIELVCRTTEFLHLFKYEGYEGDEHRMKMSLKGINNEESKLIIL